MKYRYIPVIIYFCLSFIINPLFAEEKIYIFHFKLIGSKDKDIESKVRNGMVLSILKFYPDKYKIMDDDSIQDLSKKLQKMQMAGCSEEVCIQELSLAIDARELISGSITMEGNKIRFDFKKTRKEDDFSQTLKSQVSEEFDTNQLDFFLSESSKKLIDPSYTIQRKNAPPALSSLDDLSSITNKEKPITEIYSESISIKNKILWEALQEPLGTAFDLRKKGENKKSADLFLSIYRSIEKGFEIESKEITPVKDVILSKFQGSLLLYFTNSLKEIDRSFENKKISEESALSQYESLYREILTYKKEILPIEVYYPILLRIARTYETIGDNFYRSTQFSPAKENFQKAFSYLENLPPSDKQKATLFYNTILSKKNETESVGKRFIENKVKSLCDTSKAQYNYALSIRRTRKEEADSASLLAKSLLSEVDTLLSKEKDFITPELQNYYRKTRDEQK